MIANIYRSGGFYVIQQVYVLGAILICKDLGEKRVQDRLCFQMITEWAVLMAARNTLSHNSYNIKSVYGDLSALYNSTVIIDLCYTIFDSDKPAYTIYMWLHTVLSKENIFE